MLAQIIKNISSLRYATMFKIVATATILVPLPIIAFMMRKGNFVSQLQMLKKTLETVKNNDVCVEVKLQELCNALDWVKRELIKIPSQKTQHDKSQFSWNGLLFEPSYLLLCDCLESADVSNHQLLVQKILVQVDAVCAEFTEPKDLFFNADLGYLAQAWQIKMHQVCHMTMKKKIEAFFNTGTVQKNLATRSLATSAARATHVSASSGQGISGNSLGDTSSQEHTTIFPEDYGYIGQEPVIQDFSGYDYPDAGQNRPAPIKKKQTNQHDHSGASLWGSDAGSSKKDQNSQHGHDSSDVMNDVRAFLGDNGRYNFSDMFTGKDAQWANSMKDSLAEMRERQRLYELTRDSAMENHRKQSFQNIKKNAMALLAS